MRVRNRLRFLMAEKKVSSLVEVSRGAKVHYGTLRNFYHEKYDVFNGKLIAALCQYFDCKIEDLLVLEDEKAS
ncbi:helix-turn-helix domain-containing protein [Bacillus infantis]|uniref:helix-turn-helix domain-containing protein n=1 Tax=Bacillus infantis TaxID=324767 RepID=UPI003CF14EB5